MSTTDTITCGKTAAHTAALRDLVAVYDARRALPDSATEVERDHVDAACAAASAHVDVHEALAEWEEAKQALADAAVRAAAAVKA